MTFKEGDLVKVRLRILPDNLSIFPDHLKDKTLRVSSITKDEVYIEFDGDTYGFYPHELEHTSKLHEILE